MFLLSKKSGGFMDFNLGFEELDMSAFDCGIGDIEERYAVKNRYILPKAYKAVPATLVKYERAEDLAKTLGANILHGDRVNCVLSGNFIFGDVFEALAVTHNVKFDELQLSTLSMGAENVDSFANMLDGDFLGKLEIIVSDYFWSHNRHNAPYIMKALDKGDKFQMAVAGTHTKIALLKFDDKKIVCSGSANLRSSRCVEEVCFEHNPDLYDFHHEWQSKILDQYAIIKKAVRGEALFDLITRNTEGKQKWQAK